MSYVKTDSNMFVAATGESPGVCHKRVSGDGDWIAEHASTGQQRLDSAQGETLLGASVLTTLSEYTGI